MQESTRDGAWTPRQTLDVAGPPRETGRPRPRRARRRPSPASTWLVRPLVSALFFAGLIYAVWEALSLRGVFPSYTLPSPLAVAQDFGAELANGDLVANASITLQEALGGFALAAVVAAALGYTIAHVRALEALAAPFIAASQAIPAVAIAPIVILLLGTGLLPKVVICAVVVIFPLLITAVTGLRGVGRDYHDVARVFGASRLQTLLQVELPLAAPTLLSGLKLGLTLSVVGAVVGEFVAADSGLGFMLNSAIGNFEATTRYVALIALALLSIALFSLVTVLERILLRWQDA